MTRLRAKIMAMRLVYPKNSQGWILVAALIFSGIARTQQGTGLPATQRSAGAANHYVDPALCTPCHSEITAKFAATGMGQSFHRMTPETAGEDFTPGKTFYHKASGSTFAMIERAGKYFQRRWQLGYDGKPTAVEEKQIDYVLGSGNHSRTYLHLTARGTLQELAVSWYSERGGYLAMSPGYDTADYPGSSRAIHYECMFCHNAYPKIPKGSEEEGSEAQFLRPLPEGIECQRCHGPGERHIETVGQSGSTTEQVRASIVNPARLTPEREMEVCLQCHLETTTLRLPTALLRPGRSPFSYVPGQPLPDFRLSFSRLAGLAPRLDERFEVPGASSGLRRSQCFLQSQGKLRCTTCHDPHDIPRGPEATAHYNGVCRQCHSSDFDRAVAANTHPTETNCVNCHMPKRRTDDSVHIVMTDHFIQRRPPVGNLLAVKPEYHESAENAYRGEVVPYYPAKLSDSPADLLDGAVAQIQDQSNLKNGLVRLQALIDRYRPANAVYYADLGNGYQAIGEIDKAVTCFEEAVRREPNSTIMLMQLGDALLVAKQMARAEATLRRAIGQAPADPDALGLLGLVLARSGKRADAKQVFEKAIAIDPDSAELHNYLGSLMSDFGNTASAESEFREALRIQPGMAEWQSDLASLLDSLGKRPEARFRLEQAIKLDPKFVGARLNYARLLENMNLPNDAEVQAKAATALAPNVADPHEVLGALLLERRDLNGAMRELGIAVRLQPNFGRGQYELGLALALSGNQVLALEHLRLALQSSDTQVREKAQQLIQRLGK